MHKTLLPTKLKYKILVGFCLMSVLPILAGVYVSQSHAEQAPLILLLSLVLSLLGYTVTRQMMMPIMHVSASARQMAQGQWDKTPKDAPNTADEVHELTQSLRMISQNAKELLEKVESLSFKDKLTDLYNSNYIRERLDEEIQRAIYNQHPCSFAYVIMENYQDYAAEKGRQAAEDELKETVKIINASLREFDRAGHLGHGEIAIILPDQNKKKCIEMMDQLGKKMSTGRLMPRIGVSENPIDGVHAGNLFAKAQERARTAKQKGQLLQAFA